MCVCVYVSTVSGNMHRLMPESGLNFTIKLCFVLLEGKKKKLLERQKMSFPSLTFKSNNLLSQCYCSEVMQCYKTGIEESGLCYD